MLELVIFPDARLRQVSKPIKCINKEIITLLDDMLNLMRRSSGIGLAGIQVGYQLRLVVIELSSSELEETSTEQTETTNSAYNNAGPLFLINPRVTWCSTERSIHTEGCLSIPGYFSEVERPSRVKVSYYDRNTTKQELEADGLLAVCVQHELDHLDGRLFIDLIPNEKRRDIIAKIHLNHTKKKQSS